MLLKTLLVYTFLLFNANSTLNSKELYSRSDIAKYAISAIMNQPADKMKVTQKTSLYFVSYTRANDLQTFSYKVRFDGGRIHWGTADGRWRDKLVDEKLTYSLNGQQVVINILYSDGTAEGKLYKK